MKNYFVLDMTGNVLAHTRKAEEVLDWLADPRVGLIWLTPTYLADCKCYYRHPEFCGSIDVCFEGLE